MLTIHVQYYPAAGSDRLYIPRKEGGRILMQIGEGYIAEANNWRNMQNIHRIH
jgi:hypothetical protein